MGVKYLPSGSFAGLKVQSHLCAGNPVIYHSLVSAKKEIRKYVKTFQFKFMYYPDPSLSFINIHEIKTRAHRGH